MFVVGRPSRMMMTVQKRRDDVGVTRTIVFSRLMQGQTGDCEPGAEQAKNRQSRAGATSSYHHGAIL